jgi:hypothetical protein
MSNSPKEKTYICRVEVVSEYVVEIKAHSHQEASNAAIEYLKVNLVIDENSHVDTNYRNIETKIL